MLSLRQHSNQWFSRIINNSAKSSRLHLIKQFYLIRVSKNNQDLYKLNEWILFKDKWDKYSD